MKLPPDIQNASPAVQRHFLQMVEEGQTIQWATMCALQQPPGHAGTDKTFMEGRCNGEWLNDMPKRQSDYITREAKAAGINIAGKYYHSGIADKRGWTDPEAWVSGRDDVLRVAKKRNLEVTGCINHKATPVSKPKEVGLSDSIVKRLAKKEMLENPSLKKSAAVERVKKKHTPRWKRKA
jgi:hypothetical protein